MSQGHLSSEERYVIYHLRLYGLSRREIGRRLGRAHTTIGRELRRNGSRMVDGNYWHETAHRRALERRRRPRHRRRRSNGRLHAYVVAGADRRAAVARPSDRCRHAHRHRDHLPMGLR